mmetsp:Transcript_38682/g.106547  ORF Transcript_38682/g.106547 Transcript_38682/m.106547 type:complete len:262 (-) Transcript_38682:620-1405(-)
MFALITTSASPVATAPYSTAMLKGVRPSRSLAFKCTRLVRMSTLFMASTREYLAAMCVMVRSRMLCQESNTLSLKLSRRSISPNFAAAMTCARAAAACETLWTSVLRASMPPACRWAYSRIASLSWYFVALQSRTSSVSSFVLTVRHMTSSSSSGRQISYGFCHTCASFASKTTQHRSNASAEGSVTKMTLLAWCIATEKGHDSTELNAPATSPCCQIARLQTQTTRSGSRLLCNVVAKSSKLSPHVWEMKTLARQMFSTV